MRKLLHIGLILALCVVLMPSSFANAEEAVHAALTAVYTDDEQADIAVNVHITNGMQIPIASVNVHLQEIEGYQLSANDQTVARIDAGETTDVRVVLENTSEIVPPPSTGDSAHIGLWAVLMLLSLGSVVLLSKKPCAAKRVLSLVLCAACAVSCLQPAVAYALENVDTQIQPEKLTVSTTFQTKEKALVISAVITYVFPGEEDNLNDGAIDLGDLYTLVTEGKVDAVFTDEGEVLSVDGALTDRPIRNTEDAAEVLNSFYGLFNYDYRAEPSQITVQSNAVAEGMKFYRYSPVVNGLEVAGSQIILAVDADDHMRGLTSTYHQVLSTLDTEPEISAADAENIAWEAVAATDVIKQMIAAAQEINSAWTEAELLNVLHEGFSVSSELVIYAADENKDAATVYAVSMSSLGEYVGETTDGVAVFTPILNYTCYVYANGDHVGEVHSFVSSGDSWDNVLASFTGAQNKSRVLRVQKNNDGKYRMYDAVRGIKIYHYTFSEYPGELVEAKPSYSGVFEDLINGSVGKCFDPLDVSAQYNMSHTYDFYKTVLGRDSFDDRGKTIVVTTRHTNGVVEWISGLESNESAKWDPSKKQFIFPPKGNYAAGLDVVAHEFTHAVINYIVGGGSANANKNMSGGEANALNEAYADIMGNIIEGKTDSGCWKLGEDTSDMKYDMSNPSANNFLEHYKDIGSTTNSHKRSAIFSYAAYKMMTDSRTSSIAPNTWAKLFYQSMFYLTHDATMLEARAAVLMAADDLGFDNVKRKAIMDAFDAVGIVEPDSVRIVLTWGAEPMDLDSHLVGPSPVGGRFHVYFHYRKLFTDGTLGTVAPDDPTINKQGKIVELDYDDTDGYGPEVVTIRKLTPGTYYFYVQDFTADCYEDNYALSNSGARVKVYYGSQTKPIATYSITPNKRGEYWNVFKLNVSSKGKVTVEAINTFGDTETYK